MTRSQAFKSFLKYFSKEKLPITLSDESIRYFDKKNEALNQDVIRQFIKQGDAEVDDELTEYVACCKIPDTTSFHAVIYWKAKMLSYDFVLATYNKNGVLIDRKVIAGVRSDGRDVHQSVATIDEEWIVTIVAGSQFGEEENYNPIKSQHTSLELMANGEIIFSLQN